MDAVDLQGIGVEHHQAEVGLVAGDDERLHTEGCVANDRVEFDDQLVGAGGPLIGGKLTQRFAIKRIVEVATMPAAAGGCEGIDDGGGGGRNVVGAGHVKSARFEVWQQLGRQFYRAFTLR